VSADEQPLCPLPAIPKGGSAGFTLETDGEPLSLMAIRQGSGVQVYVNRCPHWGAPLDIRPGRFLDATGRHILCSTHGALFRIEDGRCIKGPCLGAALTALPVRIEAGQVLVTIGTVVRDLI
jgi:nitrite reductase/ring-hydroxylating ferredoxin subunit